MSSHNLIGSRATARRPHAIIIAFYFPPSRASGVYRSLAMANFLVRQGWRVTVVTTTEDFFRTVTGSVDSSLMERIDSRIDIETVSIPMGHLVSDIEDMSWIRANFPRLVGKWDGVCQRAFPDRYSTWIPAVLKRILAIRGRAPVDVILATGNPWASFEAARLASKLLRVPYSLDYRDAWTLDQFAEVDAFSASHPAQAAEARVMRDARMITFVNEPLLRWHQEKYPAAADRMRIVENGYDRDLVEPPPFRVPSDDRGLRFGGVGTITEHWPHEAAWAGWMEACALIIHGGARAA